MGLQIAICFYIKMKKFFYFRYEKRSTMQEDIIWVLLISCWSSGLCPLPQIYFQIEKKRCLHTPFYVFCSRHLDSSCSFWALSICFIRYSLLEASALSLHISEYTRTTGALYFVYFAPLPELCFSILLSISLVIPV